MAVSGTHGSEGPFVFGRRIEILTSDRIYKGSRLALVCDRAVVGSKNETETCSGNGGFGDENEYHRSFDENTDEEVIIVGVGASGLAVAACLTDLGISSLVLDRDFCMGSVWKNRTYDRGTLQGSKQHANLPLMLVPDEYAMFLTRDHFVAYLEKYAIRFNIQP